MAISDEFLWIQVGLLSLSTLVCKFSKKETRFPKAEEGKKRGSEAISEIRSVWGWAQLFFHVRRLKSYGIWISLNNPHEDG